MARGVVCRVMCAVLATAILPCTAFAAPADSHTSSVLPQRALVDQYCVVCHNQKARTAGVSLEALDLSDIGANAAVMEKMLRKLRTGEMPPAGMTRPAAAASAAFAKGLEESLDAYAAAHPNPGRPAIHRLNRTEYGNAIRDLLALDINAGANFPVDDSGYGFDNIGDVLSVSPALLERYLSVARLVSRLAVGDPGMKPVEEDFPARKDSGGRGRRSERVSDDLPFDSNGGMVLQYYFPLDADYTIRVKIASSAVAEGTVPPVYEMRVPVKAGLRTVGVTFLRESAKPEIEAPAGRRFTGPPPVRTEALPAEMDVRLDGARLQRFEVPANSPTPALSGAVIGGPYNPTGRGATPSRARIFVCRPASSKDEEPCARTILASLSRRAFRRPVTESDIRPLLAFYESGRREGDFDHGIEHALRAMLVSPDFLFRLERDPRASAPGNVYRINDVDLASRLSFFLWSSIPDGELLDLAEKGKLRDAGVLDQQVRRLLDDTRSQSLAANFAGQWLYLRNLAAMRPDPDAFPEFDETLRRSFRQETELFFESIVREDRCILDLLDANYTYLNERLAEHYGIANIYGSQFRRIALADSNRGGLLGQGSILTVTSYPNRTSVVQRGKWILENLLGTPPPPPPPDVPELKPHAKDGRLLSLRQQMEQHRSNSTCAACHARMDPIGFALENYDGVGKWRTKDAGSAIDPSGKLPDGTQFEGPAGLKKVLLTARRDEFVSTFTEKLLTYALGRGLEYYDKPVVRSIVREAARNDYHFSAFINAIVNSTPFQMRRTP